MAKSATIQLPSKTGKPINVYGRVTEDGKQVAVWTKHQNVGFYNIDRFDGGTLTAASMRALLAPA